jgi:hypothetical protein
MMDNALTAALNGKSIQQAEANGGGPDSPHPTVGAET